MSYTPRNCAPRAFPHQTGANLKSPAARLPEVDDDVSPLPLRDAVFAVVVTLYSFIAACLIVLYAPRWF